MAVALRMDLTGPSLAQVESALIKFSVKAGLPLKFVVADQMRLWIQDLIKFGPPQDKSQRTPMKKSIGTKAVQEGIEDIIVPMTSREMHLTRELGGGVLGGRYRHQSKSGAVWLVDADLYQPSVTQAAIARYHQRHRTANGRTTQAGKWDRNIGRWKSIRKLHIPQRDMRAYAKLVKGHVGRLASGWLPALARMGSIARSPVRYPKWLDRVGKKGDGYAHVNFKLTGTGGIAATNATGYAMDKYRRLLPSTQAKRHKDIVQQLPKRMKTLIKQFNFGRI